MDKAPIEIKSNKHFKMLAVLVVALSILQTAYLDRRRVTPADMQAFKDSIVALNAVAISYESAKTRTIMKGEFRNLDTAIMKNILVPLQALDQRVYNLDSAYRKGSSENAIITNYRLTRIQQIMDRTDSINRWYLEDRVRF